MLKQPFSLGSLLLPSNVFCAPTAGCSDYAFRKMVLQYKPGLMYCEMVKMDALIRHDPHTYRLLDYSKDMHPIGGQICGSKPSIAGKCAAIIEDLGFDVVDLNCGCPVDKVTKDGSGSAMLKTPELIGDIISNMVAAVKIPVTVKIRAGWDSEHINAPEIVKIAEKAGAKAICVHGRTRAQGYKGPANWDYIKAAKEAANTILVIGNGDVVDGESAQKMFEHTGCDAILTARATFGKPWLFEEIYQSLLGLQEKVYGAQEYRAVLLQHLEYITSYQCEKRALLDLRRIGCWYLKNSRGAKELREMLTKSKNLQEIRGIIEGYSWDRIDFSAAPIQEELECSTC
ncbi:MAG: tRNA dihydrouridine synthase DusB [Chlamydiae bacterium]|nr:tRNA dihydrouridine synthase DusB [Chlamydiota bacterium]